MKFNYRPEIDGLRSLAVILVILFHANFDFFKAGFIGVDIFFVISGYLITSIIIANLKSNAFTALSFYENRARRILPALFLVTASCIPFAFSLMLPSQLESFSKALLSILVFSSNILFWQESNYFNTSSETNPLIHTWSLAIEEQFYFIFPILLLFFWKREYKLTLIVASISIVSLLIAEWGWRNAPSANFYLAPTRIWELLSGTLVALKINKHGYMGNNFLSLGGIALILFSIGIIDKDTNFPSLISTIPILGTILIILFTTKETWLGKILSAKPIVFVGLISYSLYLWHQPILAFSRIYFGRELSNLYSLYAILASLILAILSWNYIEKPFRSKNSKNKLSLKLLFLPFLTILLFGVAGIYTKGYENRFQKSLSGDINHSEFFYYLKENYLDCSNEILNTNALKWKGHKRCKQSKSGELDWILLGDSHAEHLYPGIASLFPEQNIGYIIQDDLPLINIENFKYAFDYLGSLKHEKLIFISSNFYSRVSNIELFQERLLQTVQFLKNAGHEVVLTSGIPELKNHPEHCIYEPNYNAALKACSIKKSNFMNSQEGIDRALYEVSSQTSASYIKLYDVFCEEDICSAIKEKQLFYRDTNHLNIDGSMELGGYISVFLK